MSASIEELRTRLAAAADDAANYASALQTLARLGTTLTTTLGDLSDALKAYVPPRDPAFYPPLSYSRFLHEVDNTSIDIQVARWAVQVIQGDEWHLPQLQALRAAKAPVTLRYVDPIVRRAGDPLGATQCLAPSVVPDEWMLPNKYKTIIHRKRDSDQFIDPGNPDYQRAAATALIDVCQNEGWQGVWLDEINPDPTHSFNDNQGNDPAKDLPVKYPTPYAYSVAIRSFTKAIAGALREAGLQTWVNLGAQFDPKTGLWSSWSKGVAAETDGHTFEFFVARGGFQPPVASLENGYWKPTLDWLRWQAGQKCRGMFNAQTTNPALVRYVLATCLLAAEGNLLFGAGVDPYSPKAVVWTEDMVNAQKLGRSVGATVVAANGVHSRGFEHGMVSVNPSEKAQGGMPALSGVIDLR